MHSRLDDRILAASTDEDDDGTSATPSGEEKTKRTYAPRRKFQWNDKIRSDMKRFKFSACSFFSISNLKFCDFAQHNL